MARGVPPAKGARADRTAISVSDNVTRSVAVATASAIAADAWACEPESAFQSTASLSLSVPPAPCDAFAAGVFLLASAVTNFA